METSVTDFGLSAVVDAFNFLASLINGNPVPIPFRSCLTHF